jgi:hypothetical protein
LVFAGSPVAHRLLTAAATTTTTSAPIPFTERLTLVLGVDAVTTVLAIGVVAIGVVAIVVVAAGVVAAGVVAAGVVGRRCVVAGAVVFDRRGCGTTGTRTG